MWRCRAQSLFGQSDRDCRLRAGSAATATATPGCGAAGGPGEVWELGGHSEAGWPPPPAVPHSPCTCPAPPRSES